MTISYVPYDLEDGYVHHWLVAGPQTIDIQRSETPTDTSSNDEIAQHYYQEVSGIEQQPVEPGPLSESKFVLGDYEGLWAYYPCDEDHYVDFTDFYPSRQYVRAWAYTQLTSARVQTALLVLTADGPADIWLNGAHIYRGALFGRHHDTVSVDFMEGANELLVRFEQGGWHATCHQLALRITNTDHEVGSRVPTAIPDVKHRNRLAAAFNGAYLTQDLFIWDEMIAVHWPEDLDGQQECMIRLQTPSGRIYAESKAEAVPGQPWTLVHAHDAPRGPLRLRLMPRMEQFYDENLRVMREIPLWGTGLQTYADASYGTYPQRRVEALRHATLGNGLFAEIARMALGQWDLLDSAVFMRAIETINRGEDHCALYLTALLGVLYRWSEHPSFPSALLTAMKGCILDFQGWEYEPESNDHSANSESTRLLLYTSEALSGQRYPDRVFSHSGQTGQWHQERGEQLTLNWLRQHGVWGFADWDSARGFEAVLVALSHLMDLSETEPIWQMVTVMMDQLLFAIALNTYKGVFGATQGAADVTSVYGGAISPTTGITRLLWGEGIFNHHLAGLVSIACMEDYTLPPLIPEIATSEHEEAWNREHHAPDSRPGVNKVTYRTPDYLLASTQDYRPGERGTREHLWQATLGPTAVVYTTHPSCMRQGEGHAPGFWLGNATLPRVAQWKDVLIAVYNLPDDDWMGFTHAYFPAFAFDAYVIRESLLGQPWAFAQKGAGYVALTASTGLTWMTRGPGAYRELRSYGQQAIWCCQMGRAALDGEFEAFQERVLSRSLIFDTATVRYETLRGETLEFGWEGPLLYNGKEAALSGFKHYENPYCIAEPGAPQMEIRSEQYLMRLSFA